MLGEFEKFKKDAPLIKLAHVLTNVLKSCKQTLWALKLELISSTDISKAILKALFQDPTVFSSKYVTCVWCRFQLFTLVLKCVEQNQYIRAAKIWVIVKFVT